MRVKICGITSFEDAMHAIDSGADALGFVFYKGSPRYISPSDAALIIESLPPFVEKVGLFVDHTAQEINAIAKTSGITLIQLHFDATSELMRLLEKPYIPVIRAQKAEDINRFPDQYKLIDAYSEAYGGIGKRLNLEWFTDIDCSKIILAGGLNCDNVQETLAFNFYALDISSGVEYEKGKKDFTLVKTFLYKAKQC